MGKITDECCSREVLITRLKEIYWTNGIEIGNCLDINCTELILSSKCGLWINMFWSYILSGKWVLCLWLYFVSCYKKVYMCFMDLSCEVKKLENLSAAQYGCLFEVLTHLNWYCCLTIVAVWFKAISQKSPSA